MSAAPAAALDEDYVGEILAAMPSRLTRDGFRARTLGDVNGGYSVEVTEAERRYFADKRRGGQ